MMLHLVFSEGHHFVELGQWARAGEVVPWLAQLSGSGVGRRKDIEDLGDMGFTLAREWLKDVELDGPLRGVGNNHRGLAKKHVVGACHNLGGKGDWRVFNTHQIYCGPEDGISLWGNGEIPIAVAANYLDSRGCDGRSGHDLGHALVYAGMNEEQAFVQPKPNLNSFPLKRLAVA